ncbi:MAG: hypothetical protein KAY37_17235 [Phycisphaerae bacterium]|nr:hypothetical protein [Phycisphaerae bacterium]
MFHALAPLALLLALGQSEAEVGTGPQPSPNPISWEYKFTFLDPQRIEIQLPDSAEPEVYWYLVYTVANTGQRSQHFFPLFQIVTEDLRVFDTDMGISPLVFDAIRERHNITHKYLVHPTKAIGPLLAGEDNARESVAIWRQIDLTQNNFRVYVAGLSGETRFVPNPSYNPDQPETEKSIGPDGRECEKTVNPTYFTLRKTLEIRYTLPGSPNSRFQAVPERGEIRWLMR